MSFDRYHLKLKSGRTSVSMDNILSELIAIKLGKPPGTKEAHTEVRKQLQSFIEHDLGRSGIGLGKYVKEKAILFVSDNILSEKYWDIAFKRMEEEEA